MKKNYNDGPPLGFEEEIELRQIIEILLRWKWMIISLVIIAVAAAAVISHFVLTPRYETTAKVFFDQAALIEESNGMATYEALALSESTLGRIVEKKNVEMSPHRLRQSYSLEVDSGSRTISITASSPDPRETQELAELWLESFSEDVYRRTENITERELKEVEQVISSLEEEFRALGGALNLHEDEESLLQVGLGISYGERYAALIEKREQLANFRDERVEEEYLQVLEAPIIPASPVAPRPELNMAVAGILALLVGSGFAFFLEYWRSSGIKNRDEEE